MVKGGDGLSVLKTAAVPFGLWGMQRMLRGKKHRRSLRKIGNRVKKVGSKTVRRLRKGSRKTLRKLKKSVKMPKLKRSRRRRSGKRRSGKKRSGRRRSKRR